MSPAAPHYDFNTIELAFNNCMLQAPSSPNDTGVLFCPRTFDGWRCWNTTLAGEIAYVSCPEFVTGFDPTRLAHKACLDDGTWFRHPDTNKSWSNYTSCVDVEDLKMRLWVNKLYVVGYSISVVALVLSMVIFFCFKSLKCTRITIHKNLFLSFIINNSVWIAWYTLIDKPEVFWENEVSCQVFHVWLQYFLVCNYFWMFCEGLYLHTLLVVAFVNEESIMKWLYVIGWAIPAVLTIIYGFGRGTNPEETVLCWLNPSPFTLILMIPVCISMGVNFFFLINILRVLITKLRAVNSPDVNQTRKAVRATLILIPLLGLHYLVMPFRPDPHSPGENIYQTVSAVVTAFQGLSVACLFCFFNGEVLSQVTKRWSQRRMSRNRSYSVAATSVSQGVRNNSVTRPLVSSLRLTKVGPTLAPPKKCMSLLRGQHAATEP